MMGLFQNLVAIQHEIYLAVAERIGDFARTGYWTLLAAYLPMASCQFIASPRRS